ncbi:hypothetical protein Bca4012_025902 [Brassica carinata]
MQLRKRLFLGRQCSRRHADECQPSLGILPISYSRVGCKRFAYQPQSFASKWIKHVYQLQEACCIYLSKINTCECKACNMTAVKCAIFCYIEPQLASWSIVNRTAHHFNRYHVYSIYPEPARSILPLPAKMFTTALITPDVPIGVCKVHIINFFDFMVCGGPCYCAFRTTVLMPRTAMAITIRASILGQLIRPRAENHRLTAATANKVSQTSTITGSGYNNVGDGSSFAKGDCGAGEGVTNVYYTVIVYMF